LYDRGEDPTGPPAACSKFVQAERATDMLRLTGIVTIDEYESYGCTQIIRVAWRRLRESEMSKT
jgi:hypothetical protein